jgi:hypothetical protein
MHVVPASAGRAESGHAGWAGKEARTGRIVRERLWVVANVRTLFSQHGQQQK